MTFTGRTRPVRTSPRSQLALADRCLVLQEPTFGVWCVHDEECLPGASEQSSGFVL